MFFSLKYLLRRKVHTFYLMGTIILVTSLIVCMGSIAKSFRETLVSHKRNTFFDLMLTPSYSSGEKGFYLDVDDYSKKLKNIREVTRIEPVIETTSFAKSDGEKIRLSIASYSKDLTSLKLDEGYFPKSDYEIVVDRSINEGRSLSVGSKIQINKKLYTISGFTINHRYYEWPVIFIKLNMLQEMLKTESKCHYFLIDISKGANINVVEDKIKKTLMPLFRKSKLPDGSILIEGVKTTTKQQSNRIIDDYFAFMDQMLALLTGLILSIGILVIGTSVYASVIERAKSIGTIRAIGANNKYLSLMIIKELALVTLPSFLVGIILGFFITFLFSKLMHVDVFFDYKNILTALSYSTLIASFGGLLGVIRTLRTDPLLTTEAL